MKNDGGPAFPKFKVAEGGLLATPEGGLSLRDWFAGMAMQGAMANERLLPSTESELAHLAMRVYEMADAMIQQRDKDA